MARCTIHAKKTRDAQNYNSNNIVESLIFRWTHWSKDLYK